MKEVDPTDEGQKAHALTAVDESHFWVLEGDLERLAEVRDLLLRLQIDILTLLFQRLESSRVLTGAVPSASGANPAFWTSVYQHLIDPLSRPFSSIFPSQTFRRNECEAIVGGYNILLELMEDQLHRNLALPSSVHAVMKALRRVAAGQTNLVLQEFFYRRELHLSKHTDALNELEVERLVTKSMLEHAPVAVARLDTEMTVLECNQQFLAIVGDLPRHAVIGRTLPAIVPAIKAQILQRVLVSGEAYRKFADPIAIAPRAVQFWDWACWPVNYQCGTNVGLIALLVDATARLLAQQQREDFVAMLSHDLKTPIIAASRTLELFLGERIGPLNSHQQELLQAMLQSNDNMFRMIQNLLDVYLLDCGLKQPSMALFDLSLIIADVVQELAPLAAEKNVVIENCNNVNDLVICDRDEIRRVFSNLIGNAIKFSPRGSSISVEWTARDGDAQVSVRDRGRGISEEHRARLFSRGFKGKPHGYSSSGLGLFLCRKIVEMHGGTISCTSEPGKGSAFTFSLNARARRN